MQNSFDEPTFNCKKLLSFLGRSYFLFQKVYRKIPFSFFYLLTRGYQFLYEAAGMGHANAEVEIGFGHLTGAFLPQNVAKAREIFHRHAAKGNPRAQAV